MIVQSLAYCASRVIIRRRLHNAQFQIVTRRVCFHAQEISFSRLQVPVNRNPMLFLLLLRRILLLLPLMLLRRADRGPEPDVRGRPVLVRELPILTF